jgi:hypothetical protein
MRESFFTRDLLPNFRSVGICDRSREQKKKYESRKCSRAIHRLGRFNIWLVRTPTFNWTVGRWALEVFPLDEGPKSAASALLWQPHSSYNPLKIVVPVVLDFNPAAFVSMMDGDVCSEMFLQAVL